MKPFHQVFLNKAVINHLQIQTHTSGLDRRQKCIHIAGQQHDHCIFRWFFYCFEKSILCLYRHHLRIRNNVNLVRTAVWLNRNIVNHLFPDLINRDCTRFLMIDHNDVRMILAQCLLTGVTFLTWLCSTGFTLQCHRICGCKKLLAGSGSACKNI